jgi:hypothetical protein
MGVPPAERAQPITAELKAFFERGASVMVGTRDADCVPELVRAWGPRVSRDRRSVSVCVAMAVGARTLENLRDNGRLAVTFALPANSNAIQVWGRCTGTGEAQRQDLAAVRAHRDAFARVNEGLGLPRPFIEALWKRELAGSPVMLLIRFAAEQIFNQTPGPDAGSLL